MNNTLDQNDHQVFCRDNPMNHFQINLPMSLDIRSWLKQIVSIVEVFEIVLKIREIFFCVLEKN